MLPQLVSQELWRMHFHSSGLDDVREVVSVPPYPSVIGCGPLRVRGCRYTVCVDMGLPSA